MTTLEVSLSMAERGDATAARALEDEIGRRGHRTQEDFVLALVMICDRKSGVNDIFTLLCATPAQIAAAYREATERKAQSVKRKSAKRAAHGST